MNRRAFLQGGAAVLPAFAALPQSTPPPAAAPPAFALPKPQTQGGLPLMEALSKRRTNRNIGEQKLSPQQLSNLLRAAFGQNRPGSGFRTAPSAVAVREIDIFVFLAEGVYLFDAAAQALKPVLAGDHRARTGKQAGVGKAPVSLLYVADLDEYTARSGGMKITDPGIQLAWSNAHAGFIGQNVYLYAASEGLACWFRALIDADDLSKLLNLRSGQKVLYAQGVGYAA
jgi:nitroreductase